MPISATRTGGRTRCPVVFKLSHTRGTKTVYFQVRRFRSSGEASGEASMQSVSEIVHAEIVLQ